MNFSSMEGIRAACRALPAWDADAARSAARRQDTLTKPPGSLGRLEDIAVFLAGWQGRALPALERVHILVFAGSHGVAARGVSAFPAEVTHQMVANFHAGGAAINQLAKAAGAQLGVIALDVGRATGDITCEPAMSEEGFLDAVRKGYEAVPADADLVCLGEMGIGNTTVAAAVASALFGGAGAEWVGRGTGVDNAGLSRKAAAVDAARTFHGVALADPLSALQRVGGRELAAIFGAALGARHRRIPILLDGFPCTTAVAPLMRLNADGLAHALAGHVSDEAAHRKILAATKLSPLLDLRMRLGEGSGAAVAISILRAAIACHGGMASFEEAGVSGKVGSEREISGAAPSVVSTADGA